MFKRICNLTNSDNFYVALKFIKLFAEKSFECQICYRKYSAKTSLKQHMRIHDDLKAHKCDVCLKVFPTKSQLKMHYRTHTGEKPFACQMCDKKFAR